MKKTIKRHLRKNNVVKLDPKDFINSYLIEITRCLALLDKGKIALAVDMLTDAYNNDRKVFIIGNGGAASTASHMACDLGKGTLQRIYDNTERRFRVMSLVDNVALMTALANDLSFEDIFVQQLRNLLETDDVVIALSGSGNSPNILKALEYVRSCGAKSIGILGFKTGGKAGTMVDCSIIIDSNHYGPIEDIQLVLNHIIAAWLASIKKFHDKTEHLENQNKAVPFR